MSLFRFAISVFANLIMALAGGFLTYLGTVGLWTTLQAYLFLEEALPGSDVRMSEAPTTDGGSQLGLFADLTPWLILFGELIVGLPLLILGIFRLSRRLQSGLPDEQEEAAGAMIAASDRD